MSLLRPCLPLQKGLGLAQHLAQSDPGCVISPLIQRDLPDWVLARRSMCPHVDDEQIYSAFQGDEECIDRGGELGWIIVGYEVI